MARQHTQKQVSKAIARAEKQVRIQNDISADTVPDGGIEVAGIPVRSVSAFDIMLATKLSEMDLSEVEQGLIWAYCLTRQKPSKLWRLLAKPGLMVDAAIDWSAEIEVDRFKAVTAYANRQYELFTELIEAEIGEGDGAEGNV